MANHSAQLVEHLAGLKPALLDGPVGTLGTLGTNATMALLDTVGCGLYGAIQQWALENRKVAASQVDWRGILPYLKGTMLPPCPSGGTYLPGQSVSASPTCSVPGHTL